MALAYVDPQTKRSRRYRAMERFGRSRFGQLWARQLSARIDPWLYRVTNGRLTEAMGTVATAPLVANGARTGLPREVQLTYFHDGTDVIVLASNFGRSSHPNWYYNVRAHPECRFGGQPFVAAEVFDPAEYRRLFALAVRVYGGYQDYVAKTAPVNRTIPMIRLRPA